jgi:UDP-N-acetyl-D-mannosaminuronic acid dehydrogenase
VDRNRSFGEQKIFHAATISNPAFYRFGSRSDFEKFKKVLVIGLGELGLSVAKYIMDRGFETYGFDINPDATELADHLYGIKNIQNFSDMDVLVICISTHKSDDIYSPETGDLMDLAFKISKEAKDGALVSIESTIPKGISKKMFEIMNHRVHVVHVPHRWYALEEEIHGVNQLRVIGGVSKCCLKLGLDFYGAKAPNQNHFYSLPEHNSKVTFSEAEYSQAEYNHNNWSKCLSMPLHPVSEIEIAELTKIVENAYRYVQIAFAEELYLYCKENDVCFSELRSALNTKWNVDILEPREGIGGHCLPKDTKMFLQSSKLVRSKIVAAAIDADAQYRSFKGQKNGHPQSISPALNKY